MSKEDVRASYLKEPWGVFLDSIGMDPYETESQARFVAKKAAERIKELEALLPEREIKMEKPLTILASGERTVFLTLDGFEEMFKPQKNHLDENASYNGWGYETFNAEGAYVAVIHLEKPKLVWTLLNNDTGVNGYTRVNRLLYMIATVPFQDNVSYVILDRAEDLNFTAKSLLEICLAQNGLTDLSEEDAEYTTMIEIENAFGNAEASDIVKLVSDHLGWVIEETDDSGVFHPREV